MDGAKTSSMHQHSAASWGNENDQNNSYTDTFQTNIIKCSACHQRYDVTVAQQLQTASTELSYFAAGVCVPSQNFKCLPTTEKYKKVK